MFKYNTNFLNRNRSGQIHFDLSKSPNKYVVTDASFALAPRPRFEVRFKDMSIDDERNLTLKNFGKSFQQPT